MPKKKNIEQKKQRFDNVFLPMTSFCGQISEKIKVLGQEKNLKLKNTSKSP